MKTKLLLTAIFSIALWADSFANHIMTALHLRMFDGRPISVMVDGMPSGVVASQQQILNLAPGVHRLKVFAVQHHPFGWQGSMTLVFRGSVEVFEGFATFAVIHRRNSLIIEDYEALCGGPLLLPGRLPCNLPAPFPCEAIPDNGVHCSLPGNANGCNTGNSWGSYPGTGFRLPMSQNDFSQLLRVIESKSFESTRREITMGAIAGNYFTSNQIRQLLNTFTFESTKIEVAKKAYHKVVDPDKYYVVYDAFSFESSINDLQACLK